MVRQTNWKNRQEQTVKIKEKTMPDDSAALRSERYPDEGFTIPIGSSPYRIAEQLVAFYGEYGAQLIRVQLGIRLKGYRKPPISEHFDETKM
jgi:hypothetical protein